MVATKFQIPDLSVTKLSREYESIRDVILNNMRYFLPEYTAMSPMDPGVVIAQALAVAVEANHYYSDAALEESFPLTAIQRQSVVDGYKPYGYMLDGAKAALADLRFTVTLPASQSADITIPEGFQVSTQGLNGTTVYFETNEEAILPYTTVTQAITPGALSIRVNDVSDFEEGMDVQISDAATGQVREILTVDENGVLTSTNSLVFTTPVQGSYIISDKCACLALDVLATEGTTAQTTITPSTGASGLSFQRYPINVADIIFNRSQDSVVVEVDNGSGYDTWAYVANLSSAESTDKVYTIDKDADDYLTIIFGNGTFGVVPSRSATVRVTYRTGGGLAGEVGAGTINQVLTTLYYGPTPVSVAVTNELASYGAAERESIVAANNVAPGLITANSRAVRISDFEDLAEDFVGVGKAKAVKSGINSVTLTIWASNGEDVSADLLDEIEDYFTNEDTGLKMLTDDVEVQEGNYVDVAIEGTVTIDDGYNPLIVKRNLETGILDEFFKIGNRTPGSDVTGVGDIKESILHRSMLEADGVYSVDLTKLTIQPTESWSDRRNTVDFGEIAVDDTTSSRLEDATWRVNFDDYYGFSVLENGQLQENTGKVGLYLAEDSTGSKVVSVTIPTVNQPVTLVGLQTGPFDLSAVADDGYLYINIDGNGYISINLLGSGTSTSSARSARDIADSINVAFEAHPNYGVNYSDVAQVVNQSVTLTTYSTLPSASIAIDQYGSGTSHYIVMGIATVDLPFEITNLYYFFKPGDEVQISDVTAETIQRTIASVGSPAELFGGDEVASYKEARAETFNVEKNNMLSLKVGNRDIIELDLSGVDNPEASTAEDLAAYIIELLNDNPTTSYSLEDWTENVYSSGGAVGIQSMNKGTVELSVGFGGLTPLNTVSITSLDGPFDLRGSHNLSLKVDANAALEIDLIGNVEESYTGNQGGPFNLTTANKHEFTLQLDTRASVLVSAMGSSPTFYQGTVAGPYNLSTNYNIKLSLDGKSALTINCRTGAISTSAVLATEVASAINAALVASGTYGAAYAGCASVVGNYVKLTGVSATGLLKGIKLEAPASLDATALIFGVATLSKSWPSALTVTDAVYNLNQSLGSKYGTLYNDRFVVSGGFIKVSSKETSSLRRLTISDAPLNSAMNLLFGITVGTTYDAGPHSVTAASLVTTINSATTTAWGLTYAAVSTDAFTITTVLTTDNDKNVTIGVTDEYSAHETLFGITEAVEYTGSAHYEVFGVLTSVVQAARYTVYGGADELEMTEEVPSNYLVSNAARIAPIYKSDYVEGQTPKVEFCVFPGAILPRSGEYATFKTSSLRGNIPVGAGDLARKGYYSLTYVKKTEA